MVSSATHCRRNAGEGASCGGENGAVSDIVVRCNLFIESDRNAAN